MDPAILIDLLGNAELLLALILLYDVLALRRQMATPLRQHALTGGVLGIIGIALMYKPFTYIPGVIFDTRTVLLGLSGLFFGPAPSLVAMLMVGALRLFQGGSGVWMGIATIVSSTAIGIAWRRHRAGSLESISVWELYIFGLAVHAVMLLCTLLLPSELAQQVLIGISLPVLVIYPPLTALLGLVLARRLRRKQFEESLRISEERWQFALLGSGDGVFDWDIPKDQTYFSPQWKALLGYAESEILHTHQEWKKRIHPGDYESVTAELERHFRGETPIYAKEYRMRCKNGAYKWVLARGKVVRRTRSGEPLRFIGTHRDITGRKQDEEERKATIDLLRLVNTANDQRQAVRTLLDYLKDWSGCEAVGLRLQEGAGYPYYEASGFSKDFLRTESNLCVHDADGAVLRDGSGNPILQCMCGNVMRGRFDPARPFFTANGSFWTNSTTTLLATASEDDLLTHPRNRCHREGYESVALIPLRSGEETLGLIQLNDRQKGRFSAEQIALFERLAGNIANFLAKKKAEDELRASQERFRALYEYSPVSIWEVDFSAGKAYINRLRQQEEVDFQAYFENHPDEVMACLGFVKILRANRESLRLFNLNSKDELSTYLPDFIIQESRGTIVNLMVDLAGGKTLVRGETTIGTRSAGRQELIFQLSVVPGCEATLSQVMISLWDITEHKRVEVELRDRVVERETLLRELYHRTKNNMQVIRSMLMLQSAGSTHPEVLSLVQEVDHKIQAMSLVHQMLCQSNNLTSIDLEAYVRDLAHLAFSSYRPAPNQVALSLSLEPILVTIDVATPLGLVVNELFSNAFKHAFLGGRPGEICIALRRAEDGRISLKFADDGVGVPPGFDPRQQKTFGLTSVLTLVERQLNGRIECDTRQGLAYTIEFADTPFSRKM